MVSRETTDAEVFSWAPGMQPWLPGGTYVGTHGWWTSRVSRDEAMSVPAVLRGRNLICSVASLPLRLLDATRAERPSTFLKQIDLHTSNVVTLAQTLDDLVCESASWWEITHYDWGGFPAHARHLDFESVSMSPPPGYPVQTLPSGLYPAGVVYVMGSPVDARQLIRFDSPNDPLLRAGARAIRRAIKLAQAAEMYADDPEARAYWTPKGDADPGDETTIRGWIAAFIRARRERAEGYVPAAMERTVPAGPSAVDIQLAQLQQRSDMEIANVLGIDPEDIGVNTTSRTYNNATDRRVDRLNTVLAPYMRAITDRLSLADVTRRGQTVAFDLDDYLKADPATRWSTYATALDKQIMTVGEVREKEGLPAVPIESAPVSRETDPLPVENTAPVSRETGAALGMQHFTAPVSRETTAQSFAFDAPTTFTVDTARRRIAGEILPYNVIGRNWAGAWRFEPGSIEWNTSAVSRVKLNQDHYGDAFGHAVQIKNSDTAVTAEFKIGRGAFADARLTSAEDEIEDGLSAEVNILDYSAVKEDGETINVVSRAVLTGVALTARPAFDDARVTKVAASKSGGAMPPTITDPAPAPAPAPVPEERFTAALEAFASAVSRLNDTLPGEQRGIVPAVTSIREPMVYSLDGIGPSYVRDAWNVKKETFGAARDEALSRLRKYSEQTAAIATVTAQRFANAGNTTDQADIIPPGYRPDLYVGQLPQGRPLFDAMGTRVKLINATPFKVPYWVGSAGLSGTNTENTGPSTGTITDHDYTTVTPTAQSGEFLVSRELVDSANPAIDVIAMRAMREEYGQDTETIIAAAIAAATDDGSPVQGTSDTSTEGCYVYVVTGTGNDLAIEGIRFMEAEFPGHRFAPPDRMLLSPTGFAALAQSVDDVGRPMFPFLGAANTLGTVGRASQSMSIDGMAVPQAWSMTSTYDDVLLFNSTDLLVGESPLLTFRFEEKSGPESIVLNLWAYFAFQILRPAGIHTCNYTAA
jgi:hypothetical protein